MPLQASYCKQWYVPNNPRFPSAEPLKSDTDSNSPCANHELSVSPNYPVSVSSLSSFFLHFVALCSVLKSCCCAGFALSVSFLFPANKKKIPYNAEPLFLFYYYVNENERTQNAAGNQEMISLQSSNDVND